MMGMKPKTDQEYHGPWSVDNSQFVETAPRQKRRRLWTWSAASAEVLHIRAGVERYRQETGYKESRDTKLLLGR